MEGTRTRLCPPQTLGNGQSERPAALTNLEPEEESRWEEPWEPEWDRPTHTHVRDFWLKVGSNCWSWKVVVLYQGGRGEVGSTEAKVSG